MFVAGLQHTDSVVRVRWTPFHILSHYRLLQGIAYSSLEKWILEEKTGGEKRREASQIEQS